MAGPTTGLSALAGESVAATDLLPIIDVTGPTSMKITVAEFHETYPVVISSAMTGSGAHVSQDKMPYWDNGVPKTIVLDELHAGIIALAPALAGASAHATQDHVLISD